MFNIDKESWSKVIEDTVRLLGYDGIVTIDDGDEPGEYLIYHSAFGVPFIGMPSKVEEMFTVLTSDHKYKDYNDLERVHKEGIVFNATTKTPLFYSIKNGPEYQRVMITDFMGAKKGEILYTNESISGGFRQHSLVKPYFHSEVFDIHTMIINLRYIA